MSLFFFFIVFPPPFFFYFFKKKTDSFKGGTKVSCHWKNKLRGFVVVSLAFVNFRLSLTIMLCHACSLCNASRTSVVWSDTESLNKKSNFGTHFCSRPKTNIDKNKNTPYNFDYSNSETFFFFLHQTIFYWFPNNLYHSLIFCCFFFLQIY